MGGKYPSYQPAGTVMVQLSYNCAYELLTALQKAMGSSDYNKKKKKDGKKDGKSGGKGGGGGKSGGGGKPKK